MRTLVLTISFISLIVTMGCRKALKNAEDYYPEAEITSATIMQDGTVKVVGEVTSVGKYKGSVIDLVGFCATTASRKPILNERQITATLDGNTFTAFYPAGYFDEDSTYNISAWATNHYGYAVSSYKSFGSLFLDVTPTCNLPVDYYQSGINTGYYSSVQEVSTNEFWASNGPYRCSIEFPTSPTAGVFKTNAYAEAGKVKCGFYQGGSWYALTSGKNVYVQKMSSTVYRVTICDAQFQVGSITVNASTSFDITL
jgi:hypothetical protein